MLMTAGLLNRFRCRRNSSRCLVARTSPSAHDKQISTSNSASKPWFTLTCAAMASSFPFSSSLPVLQREREKKNPSPDENKTKIPFFSSFIFPPLSPPPRHRYHPRTLSLPLAHTHTLLSLFAPLSPLPFSRSHYLSSIIDVSVGGA